MLCAKKPWGVCFCFKIFNFGTRIGFYEKTGILEAKTSLGYPRHGSAGPTPKSSTDIVVGGGGKCGGEQATIDDVLNVHWRPTQPHNPRTPTVFPPPGDDCEYSASKEAKMPSTFTLMALLPCLQGGLGDKKKMLEPKFHLTSPSWWEITIFPLKNRLTLFILKDTLKLTFDQYFCHRNAWHDWCSDQSAFKKHFDCKAGPSQI